MNTDKIFEKYGLEASLTDNNKLTTVNFRAFVQALRYKNKIYLRGTFTELGKNQQDYYLYLGPADINVRMADGYNKVLTVNGIQYTVDRTEQHYIGTTCIYTWAIIRPIIYDETEG